MEIVSGEAEKNRLINKAKKLMEIGEIDTALKEFNTLSTEYPDEPKVWYELLMFICDYGLCVNTDGYISNSMFDLSAQLDRYLDIYQKLTKEDIEKECIDRLFESFRNGQAVLKVMMGTYERTSPTNPYYSCLKKCNLFYDNQLSIILSEGQKNAAIINSNCNKTSYIPKFEIERLKRNDTSCIFFFGRIIILEISGYNYKPVWEYELLVANKSLDQNLLDSFEQTCENNINKNTCRICGGTFKGLFTKVCSKCGREKDY